MDRASCGRADIDPTAHAMDLGAYEGEGQESIEEPYEQGLQQAQTLEILHAA